MTSGALPRTPHVRRSGAPFLRGERSETSPSARSARVEKSNDCRHAFVRLESTPLASIHLTPFCVSSPCAPPGLASSRSYPVESARLSNRSRSSWSVGPLSARLSNRSRSSCSVGPLLVQVGAARPSNRWRRFLTAGPITANSGRPIIRSRNFTSRHSQLA